MQYQNYFVSGSGATIKQPKVHSGVQCEKVHWQASDITKSFPKKKGDANDALCVMFVENIGTPERHAGIHGKSIFSQNHAMTQLLIT